MHPIPHHQYMCPQPRGKWVVNTVHAAKKKKKVKMYQYTLSENRNANGK
jgi:hypothetical protein